jgi:SAM-dependent methyltransferase
MDKSLYGEMDRLEASHWWFRGRREVIFDQLGQVSIKGPLRVLDIGSGTGFNAALLESLGHKVTGIESSGVARDIISKERPRLKILNANLPDLSNVEGPFDLITLLDVLEHVEDDSRALMRVRDLLGQDGELILTVPAFAFLWSEHDDLAGHKRRYTKGKLSELLLGCGFRISKLSYYNFFSFPFAVLIRGTFRLFGWRSGKTDFVMLPNWINEIASRIFGFEKRILRVMDLPVGLSLLARVTRA